MGTAVFHEQLAGAGKDVLRLFGGVGMPAEPSTRLDLVDDGRRLGRAATSTGRKRPRPADRSVVLSPNFGTFELVGRDDWIHDGVPPIIADVVWLVQKRGTATAATPSPNPKDGVPLD